MKPKDRITLLACANANGNVKLPLAFIHKSLKSKVLLNINNKELAVDNFSNRRAHGWTPQYLLNGSINNIYSMVP